MGSAIISGLLSLEQPPSITVIDPSPQVAEHFAGTPVTVTTDQQQAAAAAIVVLAVKPQMGSAVAASLAPHLHDQQLLISILAGVQLRTLCKWFPALSRVVRAMPNTPMAINQGMVALSADGPSAAADLQLAQALFAPAAAVLCIPESRMDALTAISGSGPAYVFAFAEHFYNAARAQGFSDGEAQLLVSTTIQGASAYMASKMAPETPFPAAELRQQVTSPGGTTAAALAAFEAGGLGPLISQAVAAAAQRSRELAEEKPA